MSSNTKPWRIYCHYCEINWYNTPEGRKWRDEHELYAHKDELDRKYED